MVKKPIFWIVLALISIGSLIFTFKFFSKAFPIVTLELQMDRQQALTVAGVLAQEHNWGPEDYRQAASFVLEREVQNFVELEAGGNEAFGNMLQEGLYSPYTWRVRHFKQGEINETLIRFTPAGQPYGFVQKLPEDEAGASLTTDSARVIAERAAETNWTIDLAAFDLVEESQEVRPGGRTDHTFVYEQPNIQIGEGRYRLRLLVSGDKLTELTHLIKIPEAFTRRYAEMRSTNNTIATGALVVAGVLYVLGGCIIGLFFLLRQRWVIWRKALYWGVFIAFLQVLAGINQLPLAWMNFDTALSTGGFLLQQIIQLLAGFLFLSVLLTVSFIAAESLSRKAFPHHVQHWRLWSSEVASSPAILGRTVSGYLLVSVFLAFDVALYFFATRLLGWWTPSEALFQPDVLATYLPWLSSIAISAQAGFWEECLFRAIPIAGAALLGQRFGGRRIWITAAFILQALVFGAGHANYAQQPAYARVVELIIPSIGFGMLYLYFGLLPAIVLHYAVDVVYIALPLFVSSAPRIWIDQALVVILGLVPLWVIIRARVKARRWNELRDEHYNRSWSPPTKAEPEPVVSEIEEAATIGSKTSRLVIVGGVVGLVIWVFATNFLNYAPSLSIGRNDAIGLARSTLSERGMELSDSWQALSSVETPLNQNDRFIWQEGGEEVYKNLLENYLGAPRWKIRFVQFEGDVAERAEEYQVFIEDDGEVVRVNHQLPEDRPGANLDEDAARAIADSVLKEEFQMEAAKLKFVFSEPSKLSARTDWQFTFADTLDYPLEEGEARITVKVAGDRQADAHRYIHVPEEWDRTERNKRNVTRNLQIFCGILLFILILTGAISAIVGWSRKNFSVPTFFTFFGLLLGLRLIGLINGWPATVAGFSTAEPLSNQTFIAIAVSILGSLFLAGGLALVVGFVQNWKRQESQIQTTRAVWLGISFGASVVGIQGLLTRFAPPLEPVWANYTAVSSFIPFLGAGLAPVGQFVYSTALYLLIFTAVDRFTNGWSQRKGLFAILLVLMGVILAGAGRLDSVPFWLLSGIITGVVLVVAYQFVFRFHLALVPLVLGTGTILAELKQGLYWAYPTSFSGAILAVVVVGLLSFYWFKQLSTQQK